MLQVGLSVKYYLDQSSAQLLLLSSQLSYLRTRYGEMAGLDVVSHSSHQAHQGQCFPRKQGGTYSLRHKNLDDESAGCLC